MSADPRPADPRSPSAATVESLRATLRIAQLDSADDTNPSWADYDQALAAVVALDAVADDALALLDLHISDEQRRELGIRIIERMVVLGRLS